MRYAIALVFLLIAIRADDDLEFYASLILATIWAEGA